MLVNLLGGPTTPLSSLPTTGTALTRAQAKDLATAMKAQLETGNVVLPSKLTMSLASSHASESGFVTTNEISTYDAEAYYLEDFTTAGNNKMDHHWLYCENNLVYSASSIRENSEENSTYSTTDYTTSEAAEQAWNSDEDVNASRARMVGGPAAFLGFFEQFEGQGTSEGQAANFTSEAYYSTGEDNLVALLTLSESFLTIQLNLAIDHYCIQYYGLLVSGLSRDEWTYQYGEASIAKPNLTSFASTSSSSGEPLSSSLA